MAEVRVQVEGYADSTPEECAELAWDLQDELLDRGVDDVRPEGGMAPAGAKGGEALQWAQLVVTFAGNLPALIAAVRSWVGRHPGSSVTVELDGDQLSLSDATDEERRELVEAWLARHAA